MSGSTRKIEWVVWGALVLIIIGIAGAFVWSKFHGNGRALPVLGEVSDFTLTNQNNQAISLANLRGQVCVTDVIFTRCPGPCAKMTRQMAELQRSLPASVPVKFISFTSDPDYDTPPILNKYAERFGAVPNRWWFLTGNKQEIRRLEVNDFKFVVAEKKPDEREVPDDLFIHSTHFTLVDQNGKIRGWTDKEGKLHAYFDSEDPTARAELLSAIKQLLRENPS
ncbi:MAG: SCO1/SenC family protein [Pedosphaera sp.]|nr:SCO1/SenC family protein [Pedosphaera sp.]